MDKSIQRVRVICTEPELAERVQWMLEQEIDFGCHSLGLPYSEGNHDKALKLLEGVEESAPVGWGYKNAHYTVAGREANLKPGQRLIVFDVHEDHAVDFAFRWNAEILGRPPVMSRFMQIMNGLDDSE